MEKLSPSAQIIFALLLGVFAFFAGLISVAFVPLLVLSIQSAVFTFGWNYVAVVLFHVAPVNFWTALVGWFTLRFAVRALTGHLVNPKAVR